MELLQRWRTTAKLRRGQCSVCGKPKRDDAPHWDRFCSNECHEHYRSKTDW